MNIVARLEKTKTFWFILLLLVLFFLLRLPSLFEPYWYGDEGIYQTMGYMMRQGHTLYAEVWDNKPPLLYTLYAVLHGDQFAVRLLSLITGLFSVVLFYVLANKLFPKTLVSTVGSTVLFTVLFGLPLLEGNIANAENFILPLVITAGFLVFSFSEKVKTPRVLFLAGVLLGVAFLFKIVAIFDMAAMMLFLVCIVFVPKKKTTTQFPQIVQAVLPLMIGFIIPVLLTALFFLFTGAFVPFIKATLTTNLGYVNYGNQFIIPQGLLVLKLLLLCMGIGIIFLLRNRFTKSTLFIVLWFIFSLFNAYFSQRPYTHYLLVLLPSFCLLTGLIFTSRKYRVVLGITVIAVLILLYRTFHLYTKTPRYYQNFIAFITDQKSVAEYRAFFDRNTPRDYELADFIKTHTNERDTIFIWGDNAQLYRLTNKMPPGRFTVAYHMRLNEETLQETRNALEAAQPKLIIIMPNQQQPLPYALTNYTNRYTVSNSIIYERVY